MGAYLTVPNTEKESNNSANEFMEIGASSMQGWRISQEDAHNCLLDFDTNTSLFSVYDGHGGSEVALYCADKFPAFLKELQAYKDGDFEQALKDAFLGFDKTLLSEDVIEELKRLAKKNPYQDNEVDDFEEEEDLTELCQEGALPLQQVLEKYKGCAAGKYPQVLEMKYGGAGSSGAGSSKPISPFRSRSRRAPKDIPAKDGEEACGPSSSSPGKVCSMPDLGAGEECVSSTCSKSEAAAAAAAASNEACVSGTNGVDGRKSAEGDVDSSSSSEIKKKVQNGDITSSSSSSGCSSPAAGSTPGNGEVSSNSKASVVSSGPTEAAAAPSSASSGISSSTSAPGSVSNQAKAKAAPVQDAEMDETSSDDDDDFHAEEENSSTEDGDEECGAYDDDEETDDENEDGEEEETEDDDGVLDDDETAFCRNMIEEPGKDSGCTAVVALVNGRDLYVANAGDSRCVVSRKGKAIEMSLDHKPEDEEESDRIQKAGGKVTLDGRVNGGLNLSRAIGDHAYKMNHDIAPEKQMISALPDIRKLIISPDDEFMILACDGIWNFMSSDEVVEFVKKRFDQGYEKLSQICEELFDHCLAPDTMGDGTGCDNMTAVLVRFKPALQNLSTKISAESEAIATTKKAQNSIDAATTESASTTLTQAAAKKRPASPSRSARDDDDTAITSGEPATTASASSDRENASKRLKTDNEVTASNSESAVNCDEDVTMSAVTTSSTESSTSTVVTAAVESESTTSSTTTTTTTSSTT